MGFEWRWPRARPRVRAVEGREVALQRYQAFAHPQRMQEAVSQRILRRVSTRDYAGVLEEVCDGYGIAKSSVSRHWKAASSQQRKEMLECPLGDLFVAVVTTTTNGNKETLAKAATNDPSIVAGFLGIFLRTDGKDRIKPVNMKQVTRVFDSENADLNEAEGSRTLNLRIDSPML